MCCFLVGIGGLKGANLMTGGSLVVGGRSSVAEAGADPFPCCGNVGETVNSGRF